MHKCMTIHRNEWLKFCTLINEPINTFEPSSVRTTLIQLIATYYYFITNLPKSKEFWYRRPKEKLLKHNNTEINILIRTAKRLVQRSNYFFFKEKYTVERRYNNFGFRLVVKYVRVWWWVNWWPIDILAPSRAIFIIFFHWWA